VPEPKSLQRQFVRDLFPRAASFAPTQTRIHEFSALAAAGFTSVSRNRNMQSAPP
jgi:hypothetical protein